MRNIKLLALVSFFNDIASEATLRLLPLFLSQVLGASVVAIGLVEGIAESTATLMKLFSGWLSDRMPRRKPLVVAGYALSGLTKPFLLIANHWTWVLFIRFSDRLGKGLRSAPRDALIADESTLANRGASFGLNRALDTLGALTGLLLAWAVVTKSPDHLTRSGFDTVVKWATIPALISVLLVYFGVHEHARQIAKVGAMKIRTLQLPSLPKPFWRYMAVLCFFTLSNSSDAFLILKITHAGGTIPFVMLCLIALNLSGALVAFPAGKLSDRFGRRTLILIGWTIYAIAYTAFALMTHASRIEMLLLFLFYGCFYGFAEGAEKALVADLVVEKDSRGSAYGVFSFTVGVMSFPASFLFGLVVAKWGERTGFLGAASLAAIASLGLMFFVDFKGHKPLEA